MSLTHRARLGFNGSELPQDASPIARRAYSLGRYLHDTGRNIPTDVRVRSGGQMLSGDLCFEWSADRGWERIH